MIKELKMIQEFQDKHNNNSCDLDTLIMDGDLYVLGQQLILISKRIEAKLHKYDVRWLRAHLMLEELGELISAMAGKDDVNTLDGLSDLLYVVLGTALVFNLPIIKGLEEAHKSNMTKTKSDMRLRSRGKDYIPPDFEKILKEHHK